MAPAAASIPGCRRQAGAVAARAGRASALAACLLLGACGPDASGPRSQASTQVPALAPDAPALASRTYDCMRCHDAVIRQVGPGFAQIAARYRDDAGAADRLAVKIREGSVGTWGRLVMPRHPQVTPADAQALARWILSQPPPP
jgi:cytochrome c